MIEPARFEFLLNAPDRRRLPLIGFFGVLGDVWITSGLEHGGVE